MRILLGGSAALIVAAVLWGLPSPGADGAPAGRSTLKVTHLGMVAPDVVSVTLQAGGVEYGRQVPYQRREGDRVDRGKDRWVTRDGKVIGALVGRSGNLLYTMDRVVDAAFDAAWADQPRTYRISSTDDPAYAAGAEPGEVYRKSKPTDLARTAPWQFEAPTEHVVYLRLGRALAVGKQYTLVFTGSGPPPQAFTYDPVRLRSEAVHVSHLGFRPDDPAKVGFLSCWMGTGGPLDYAVGLPFAVVDARSGRAVLRGRTTLAKAAGDRTEDAYRRNHNGCSVYEMDFSALRRPGTYRLVVEGIGCSYPFRVADDVWRRAFRVAARGFYHQRSGIALGPPYTSFRRPRPFHPADGLQVFHSNAGLMDTGNGLAQEGSNFGNLVRGRTQTRVANAWGGYMDAGDWDRRIQHLDVARLLLELAEIFPGYFAGLSLGIPESGNALPDVVDEALWGLEIYRRMQLPDGGIRGGIESEEHPRHGEASWQESLTVMAYAPCVWSSHIYAGVAARASLWLEKRRPDLARAYRESALRAMRWAESELPKRAGRNDPHAVNDARNLAAAELFRLTGDRRWHEVFLATTAFTGRDVPLYQWQHHEQRDAAWVYVRTNRPGMSSAVKENCRAALLREAEERAARCAQTGFRWTSDAWRPFGWGLPAAPDGVTLARAHVLTGEPRYLRALVLACQVGAGANPSNLCFTTGLGHRWSRHPLHIDSRMTHQPAPPGLTVFGPAEVERSRGSWEQNLVRPYIHPDVQRWPDIEAFWDVFWYPSMCEFTVQSPMAPNAYVWGYLAARGRRS